MSGTMKKMLTVTLYIGCSGLQKITMAPPGVIFFTCKEGLPIGIPTGRYALSQAYNVKHYVILRN